MNVYSSIEEYQRFLENLYNNFEQQLNEAKSTGPAEAQHKALGQCWQIRLKVVEGTCLTVCLPSDDSSLRFEIHDGEVVLILKKGAPV